MTMRIGDWSWWTRSQRIRTAGEIPFRAVLLEAVVPAYLRIAREARTLRALGLSYARIARELKITDKTVAKALREAE
jgi:ribosome-binding protein aMBF1 (putative translation factor)